MYTEKLMQRFANPKNAGMVKNANGVGKVGNTTCGDLMKVYFKINENEVITEAKVKTFGCAAAIVSSDVAMDLVKGKTVAEALEVTNQDVLNLIGPVPQNKVHCSILAQEAIAEAIKDYRKNKLKAEMAAKKKA
jgi:nitrogen fixation NifU-like protein